MDNRRIIIFLSGLAVLVIFIVIILTISWQENVEESVGHIKEHVARQDSVIQRQDSLILDLHEENEQMRSNIRRGDSIRLAQQDTIRLYAKKMDSISVIMDYLERADLSGRYRSNKRR